MHEFESGKRLWSRISELNQIRHTNCPHLCPHTHLGLGSADRLLRLAAPATLRPLPSSELTVSMVFGSMGTILADSCS